VHFFNFLSSIFIQFLYEMADSTIEPTNWLDVSVMLISLHNESAAVEWLQLRRSLAAAELTSPVT
jgi:hypothetical protein